MLWPWSHGSMVSWQCDTIVSVSRKGEQLPPAGGKTGPVETLLGIPFTTPGTWGGEELGRLELPRVHGVRLTGILSLNLLIVLHPSSLSLPRLL